MPINAASIEPAADDLPVVASSLGSEEEEDEGDEEDEAEESTSVPALPTESRLSEYDTESPLSLPAPESALIAFLIAFACFTSDEACFRRSAGELLDEDVPDVDVAS